jgi:hypothetical protein
VGGRGLKLHHWPAGKGRRGLWIAA